jgi:hypothetical protein
LVRVGVPALVWLFAACDGGEDLVASAPDAATAAPRMDASPEPPVDASPATDAAADASEGGSSEPTINRPLPDSVCSLAVGAECDGNEDCAQGQTCCGHFESILFTYTSMKCRSACDGTNEVQLCRPGETCARAGTQCRSSLIIPYDFIGVCANPDPAVPPLTGGAAAGDIACGETACAAGSEQCCLRSRYDFMDMAISALEPYCAPLGDRCTCNHEAQRVDAGAEDAGDDAGSDDDAG